MRESKQHRTFPDSRISCAALKDWLQVIFDYQTKPEFIALEKWRKSTENQKD